MILKFLCLIISLKVPIIFVSHIIHGDTPECRPLHPPKNIPLTNHQQNKMLELHLAVAITDSCVEFCKYGLPLHNTADVKD